MKDSRLFYFSVWGFCVAGLIAASMFVSTNVVAQDQPIYISDAGLRSADVDGDWQGTLAQMRKAWNVLQSSKGAAINSRGLFYVPDQKYSEISWIRNGESGAFAQPAGEIYDEVALVCPIYRYTGIRTYRGARQTANPHGFTLVLYKDGSYDKVPVCEERVMPTGDQNGTQLFVYPKMDEYSESLPLSSVCEMEREGERPTHR